MTLGLDVCVDTCMYVNIYVYIACFIFVCCSVLQCVAMCCSVLQCVAAYIACFIFAFPTNKSNVCLISSSPFDQTVTDESKGDEEIKHANGDT